MTLPLPPLSSMHNLRYKTTLENKVCLFFCSPKFGLPMSFFLSPSSWTFPLRQGSSSSLLILPGLLRSDRGGLSVSSPSGERKDACGFRRWRKFPASEFYSASFLYWISSLSYPYFTTLYILNKRLIKQLFPDPRLAVSPSNTLDQLGLDPGTHTCSVHRYTHYHPQCHS